MQKGYSDLTPEEKKLDLFLRQKRTLDLFLERNAIFKVQYDKSLGDLIEKMQIDQSIVQGVLPESRISKQGICSHNRHLLVKSFPKPLTHH